MGEGSELQTDVILLLPVEWALINLTLRGSEASLIDFGEMMHNYTSNAA